MGILAALNVKSYSIDSKFGYLDYNTGIVLQAHVNKASILYIYSKRSSARLFLTDIFILITLILKAIWVFMTIPSKVLALY